MKNSIQLSTSRRGSRSAAILAFAVAVCLFASTFTLIASSGVALAQAADFGTADVTPETALVYVRGNLHTDSDQWVLAEELIQRSGISEAAGEEVSLDDARAIEPSIDGEVAFVLTSISADQPVDLTDVTNIASDPMTSMGTDIPSGFSVLYQPEDFDGVYAELHESIENSGTAVETSEYGGVTVEYAPPADEFSDGYAFAQVNDTTLAISTLPEDLEPIIDTANGDIEPLSGNESFTGLQDTLTTDSIVFGYVNGDEIVEQSLAIAPESEAQVPEDVLAQARVNVGFTFWADDPGFRFDSLVVAPDDAELPALTTFQPTLADRISSDSVLFLTGTELGASGALDAIGLLLAQAFVGVDTEATPAPIEDAEAYAEEIFAQAEQQVGFNLKTDFIDQLVGEYAMSVSVRNVDSMIPEVDAIFVSGADNPTTVNDVLSKISFLAASDAPEDIVTSRDLADGTSIYQFNVGDETFPMLIEFGVVEDQLVIGLNNGIDEYVDGPETALADDPNYEAVFSNLPSDITSASFVNVPKIVPILESFATSFSASSIPDNGPACAEFESQEDAQAEYEAEFNFDLDLDFDGEACEDFFNTASPEASPTSIGSQLNVLGIGTVTYDADGDIGQSTLIAIGE